MLSDPQGATGEVNCGVRLHNAKINIRPYKRMRSPKEIFCKMYSWGFETRESIYRNEQWPDKTQDCGACRCKKKVFF